MKNKLLLMMIGIFLLVFVVGCGSKDKTLECSKITEDSSGFKIEETYNYKFVSNSVQTFEVMTISTPTKEERKEFLSIFSTNVDDSFNELDNKKGIEYSSEIKDDKHVLNIKINYDNVDLDEFDDASDEINNIVNKKNKKISLSETKKEMEQAGYKCSSN